MKQPQSTVYGEAKTTFIEVWQWGQELERLHARIAPPIASRPTEKVPGPQRPGR